MLNIAYTHASVVLVIFYYYMLQNNQSNRYSSYTVTSEVHCDVGRRCYLHIQ